MLGMIHRVLPCNKYISSSNLLHSPVNKFNYCPITDPFSTGGEIMIQMVNLPKFVLLTGTGIGILIQVYPSQKDHGLKKSKSALAGVAQWTGHGPANQRFASLIPSQGTCLGCGPGPQLGAHKRQPHINVSLPLFLLHFPFL